MKTKDEIRNKLFHGDCLEILKTFPDNTVSAVVTDPPYGLSDHSDIHDVMKAWVEGRPYEHNKKGFMSSEWDGMIPGPEVWKEVLRVLKPGGHILSFSGTRTYDLMTMAIRLAGAEIRDKFAFYTEVEEGTSWSFGCVSEDTELLVNGKWEHYHKAIDGALTLCYDMDKDEFRWEKIQEVFVYGYDDTAYRIQSDVTDQIVSRNHRCIVERDGKREFRVAEEIARDGKFVLPVVEDVFGLLEAIRLPNENEGQEQQNLFRGLQKKEGTDDSKKERCKREKGACGNGVFRLQEEVSKVPSLDTEDKKTGMFEEMQWCDEGRGMGETRLQGKSRLDSREQKKLSGENDWREESSMEGGSYIFQNTRELCGSEIYQESDRIQGNGEERRICNGASACCCNGDGKIIDEARGGTSCEPRSNGQQVGESSIIRKQPRPQGIRGKGFTTSNMARIEPFHYTGKVWCVRVPTGAFVARRNGKVFVTGNSGFPKSLSIKGALEKKGVDKEISDQWEGMGTALKPAHEPLVHVSKSTADVFAEALPTEVPFLYTPKVSRKERNYGCKNLFWKIENGKYVLLAKEAHESLTAENETRKTEEGYVPHNLQEGNIHCTVKPIELARYLVKLCKQPKDNLVLDPFMGSGTTAIGCILEGMDWVGIERDDNYMKIAEARTRYFQLLGKQGLR